MPITSRLAMVDEGFVNLSLRNQFLLLSLNRSSYYYQPKPNHLNDRLSELIEQIWKRFPFLGYRKITAIIVNQGLGINRKRVQSLMQKLDLQAIKPKKNKKTKSSKLHQIYPYLLKDLEIVRTNQVWSTDITYIPMPEGWIYFTAILDLYSRLILSYRISITLEAEFCIEALNEALEKHGNPEIFNTDQGVQYTSHDWIETLTKKEIRISMDGKGRCFDNIRNERLWKTLKYEEVYLKSYESVSEARQELGKFVKFYNYSRPHQSLKYRTPAQIYFDQIKDWKREKEQKTESEKEQRSLATALSKGALTRAALPSPPQKTPSKKISLEIKEQNLINFSP